MKRKKLITIMFISIISVLIIGFFGVTKFQTKKNIESEISSSKYVENFQVTNDTIGFDLLKNLDNEGVYTLINTIHAKTVDEEKIFNINIYNEEISDKKLLYTIKITPDEYKIDEFHYLNASDTGFIVDFQNQKLDSVNNGIIELSLEADIDKLSQQEILDFATSYLQLFRMANKEKEIGTIKLTILGGTEQSYLFSTDNPTTLISQEENTF